MADVPRDLFMYTGALLERAPTQPQAAKSVDLDAEQIEAKAGTYYDAQRGALRAVTCTEGQLQYQGLVLVPVSGIRFYFRDMPDTEVEFTPAAGGAAARLKVITASGDYFYDRVERVSPTQDELAQYAGRYCSPELDLFWTIVAGDDHLVAKRRKYVDSKLTPLFTDAFNDDWLPLMGYPTTYLVVFDRDANGEVIGLRVTGTRVRNLRFVRQ